MEDRCGRRFSVDRTVRIRTANGEVSIARLQDVSISGAFLKTLPDLPYLSRIKIQLARGYDGDGSTREVEACVVRSTPEGTAIEWDEIAPHEISELIHAIGDTAANEAEMPSAAVANSEFIVCYRVH